jgi:hypothetical protein
LCKIPAASAQLDCARKFWSSTLAVPSSSSTHQVCIQQEVMRIILHTHEALSVREQQAVLHGYEAQYITFVVNMTSCKYV